MSKESLLKKEFKEILEHLNIDSLIGPLSQEGIFVLVLTYCVLFLDGFEEHSFLLPYIRIDYNKI